MEFDNFFRQFHSEIQNLIAENFDSEIEYPFPELVFTEYVMQHMIRADMISDTATVCHCQCKVGNANVKISGYALSYEIAQLDLFISLYSHADSAEDISTQDLKKAAGQCFKFVEESVTGKLEKVLEPSEDAAILAKTIREVFPSLDQIRIFVLTDRIANLQKAFAARPLDNKSVKLEVMDITRLFRHTCAGKPRDELVVDFSKVCGASLPCVYVPSGETDYAYALTVFPGDVLRFLYEKFSSRLLEANVRSFLNFRGKVNKDIRDTILHSPARFMAYNNGLVITADEIRVDKNPMGGTGIVSLKGMQIVNGGQTTASLYFTKRKFPNTDLTNIKVPAKIIILNNCSKGEEETLIAEISKFANSQTVVRQADLSANRPFHRELEQIATSLFCPDGVGQWFYERSKGSYDVWLEHEGNTPAKRKKMKARIPTSRKIDKTDLAKYINAWEKKPYIVALGSQKNFQDFMTTIDTWEADGFKPNLQWFKEAVAKTILFKQTDKMVRELQKNLKIVTASKINVTTYCVSILSEKFGNNMDFNKIWQNQDLSVQFKNLLMTWIPEVNRILMEGSQGRLLSEWAKQTLCWDLVKTGQYPMPTSPIPEIKNT